MAQDGALRPEPGRGSATPHPGCETTRRVCDSLARSFMTLGTLERPSPKGRQHRRARGRSQQNPTRTLRPRPLGVRLATSATPGDLAWSAPKVSSEVPSGRLRVHQGKTTCSRMNVNVNVRQASRFGGISTGTIFARSKHEGPRSRPSPRARRRTRGAPHIYPTRPRKPSELPSTTRHYAPTVARAACKVYPAFPRIHL